MPGRTAVLERTDAGLKEPKPYKVVMYNDDFTPMDVVVDILMSVFHKSVEEAEVIMMMVHKGKKAVAGVYSYDIARSKAAKAVRIARELGYPLRVNAEP